MSLTIGQFAQLAGVTTKTLRLYDRLGLLAPREVDSRTRYRRYAAEQLPQLAAILSLRELGIPLANIAMLARRKGRPEERRKVLARAREALTDSFERARRSLAWIEAELEDFETCSGQPAIVLRHLPPLRVASLRAELEGYAQILEVERALHAAVPESLRGLRSGVVWHRCAGAGLPEGEAFIELRAPLPTRARANDIELNGVTVACAYTDGGEETTSAAYAALSRWAEVRQYRPTGVARELYVGPLLEVQLCVEASDATPRHAVRLKD